MISRNQFLFLSVLAALAGFISYQIPGCVRSANGDDAITLIVVVFALALIVTYVKVIERRSLDVTDEHAAEAHLQAAGANAPRLNPTHIDSMIIAEQYYIFPNTTVTVCCLRLRNGFNVIGQSSCVSAENFNEALGQQYARENAREKIWELEGYLLKERLARQAGYEGHEEINAAA